MKLPVPEYILSIPPYVPGKPIAEVEREYGIRNSIKLASNENPLGPSPRSLAAVRDALENLHRYPDGGGYDLATRLAEKLGLAPENIVLGNGSDEIIGMLTTAFLSPGDSAVLPKPSFLMYEIAVRCAGANPIKVPLREFNQDLDRMLEKVTPETRMVFLNVPHNPTGSIFSKAAFEDFIHRLPSGIIIVLDEAYIEFVREPDFPNSLNYIDIDKPIVGLRTFSKAYGLAGLRVGYGLMPAEVAGILNRVRQPFNVNVLAQTAALAALEDNAFLSKTVNMVHEGLDYMYAALAKLGISCCRTQANFVLIQVGKKADEVFEDLLREGVIVRSMTSYGYPNHIRVNIGRPEENERLISALKKALLK